MRGRYYEKKHGGRVFHLCARMGGNGELVFLCGRKANRNECRLHPGIPSTLDVCGTCLDTCIRRPEGQEEQRA